MALWHRILCIILGGGLLWFAATGLLPEIEVGIFMKKFTLAAFAMGNVGGVLVAMGAFPKQTQNWSLSIRCRRNKIFASSHFVHAAIADRWRDSVKDLRTGAPCAKFCEHQLNSSDGFGPHPFGATDQWRDAVMESWVGGMAEFGFELRRRPVAERRVV